MKPWLRRALFSTRCSQRMTENSRTLKFDSQGFEEE
jgi:hypothetical protein